MSNYPVDFKGTNMDERSEIGDSIAYDEQAFIIRAIDDILSTVMMLKNFQINIAHKDFVHAYISIEQILTELLGDAYKANGHITGSYSIPASLIQLNWLRERKRPILTNQATHAVMEEIAAQNKLASESEI